MLDAFLLSVDIIIFIIFIIFATPLLHAYYPISSSHLIFAYTRLRHSSPTRRIWRHAGSERGTSKTLACCLPPSEWTRRS
jgi:hypothetical protein